MDVHGGRLTHRHRETQLEPRNGFALVEGLLGLLMLSILGAVVVNFVAPNDHNRAVAQCTSDAAKVAAAVKVYYEGHHEKAWPDSETTAKISTDLPLKVIATNLQYFGGLDLDEPLRHLDGSQRVPVSQAKGWKYVYAAHTTDASNCA